MLDTIRGGLIVSCQSEPPEPMAKPEYLVAMAQSAAIGGAVGIRTNLPQNVRAISASLDLPVIAIYKNRYADSEVIITPTDKELKALLATNADVVAMDATQRPRPQGQSLKELIRMVRNESNMALMADISTVQEGEAAAELGFDLIATTLSGYTPYTSHKNKDGKPDFQLIRELVEQLGSAIPVVAEGRIWYPHEAKEALDCGAYAVVVGTAITRPWEITKRFVRAMS